MGVPEIPAIVSHHWANWDPETKWLPLGLNELNEAQVTDALNNKKPLMVGDQLFKVTRLAPGTAYPETVAFLYYDYPYRKSVFSLLNEELRAAAHWEVRAS